eukprot:SAG31_NODE_46974_length_252_cov_0.679739_1_plen_36_part_10
MGRPTVSKTAQSETVIGSSPSEEHFHSANPRVTWGH